VRTIGECEDAFEYVESRVDKLGDEKFLGVHARTVTRTHARMHERAHMYTHACTQTDRIVKQLGALERRGTTLLSVRLIRARA
jgi:hypothetical protein